MRPTARTLKYLTDHGAMAGVVERFNRHAGPFGRHFDLFGLFDVIAVRPTGARLHYDIEREVVAIQCCSQSTRAEHETKMMNNRREKPDELSAREKLVMWLSTGQFAELWSWRKRVRLKKDLTKSKITMWCCQRTVFRYYNNGDITVEILELP